MCVSVQILRVLAGIESFRQKSLFLSNRIVCICPEIARFVQRLRVLTEIESSDRNLCFWLDRNASLCPTTVPVTAGQEKVVVSYRICVSDILKAQIGRASCRE